MYQRKGSPPEKSFPNFKMLIPNSTEAVTTLIELLRSINLEYIPKLKRSLFLIHRNGIIGEGVGIRSFIEAPLSEMTISELLTWKIVPLQMTLSEVEDMIGHKLQIIKEDK